MNVTVPAWLRIFLATTFAVPAACGGGGGGDNGGGNPPGPGPAPATVTVSLGDDRILEEGDSGTTVVEFEVTLDAAATSDVTVDYATAHVTTEDHDLVPTAGTVTIAAGETTATIVVDTAADDAFELNEDFSVQLSNASANATLGDAEALGRLVNDDPLTVIFDLWNLGYGDGFLAGLTIELDYDMLIDLEDLLRDLGLTELQLPYDIYYTSDIHIPYPVASGHLTMGVGSSTFGRLQIALPPGFEIPGLGVDGRFLVVFDWSQVLAGLPIASWEFDIPIEPGDVSLPQLNVSDATVFNEGDAGATTDATFVAYLSEPLPIDVVLAWETADQTAAAPGDYQAASGSVTIPAGELGTSFSVTVNGDDEAEGTVPEQFIAALVTGTDTIILGFPWATGYIYDDDTAVEVRRIRIHNAELVEGDSGSADMLFDVTLDAPAVTPVTFGYGTRDDTAEAGSDFEATSGERTFQPGESELTIAVPVFGDTDPEDDETFFLEVTATFDNATTASNGVGKILSDDPIARVSIDNVAVAEGDSGTTALTFTVTLSEALDEPLDIAYATNDVTATGGEDYVAASSTLSIPATATAATIDVLISGDTLAEDDEVFEVVIGTTSASATLIDDTGTGTILNDDSAGGWAGAELVHAPGGIGALPGEAVRARLAFGPAGERHVIFLEDSVSWHTVSTGRTVWSPAAEIASVTAISRNPNLFVDGDGRALVAIPNDFVESYTYSPGFGWESEALPMAVASQLMPELEGDPATGEAVAVWREPGNSANGFVSSVWSARFVPGGGWQDMLAVETTDDEAFLPAVGVGPGGSAVAVFPQYLSAGFVADIAAFHWNGSSWSGPRILDGANDEGADQAKIDINADGDAAVAWHQAEPVTSGIAQRSVYVNLYDADTDAWSGPPLVEQEMDFAAELPDVAIDAAGNVFVVWTQLSPAGSRDLLASRYDLAADEWSEPHALEQDDTVSGFPIISQQVVADDLGNAIVVWIQDNGMLQNLHSARFSVDDDEWKPNELLEEMDTGDAALPQLVIDRETGDAMVVWQQRDGQDSDIWANRYTN